MQPGWPALHLGPPRLITTWPISPAAPRPAKAFRSGSARRRRRCPRTHPARSCRACPAPRWNSPSTPTWTSLPTFHRRAQVGREFLRPEGRNPPRSQGVRAPETTPVSSFASPGEPTPTPATARPARRPARPPRAGPQPSPSPRPSGRPRWGRLARLAQHLVAGGLTTVWILVPPRSMPPRAEVGCAGLTQGTYPPSRDDTLGPERGRCGRPRRRRSSWLR